MKRIKLLFTFFIYCNAVFSQNSLRAYLDVKIFQSVKNESYIEVFDKINAVGLEYKNINNKLTAKVLVIYSIYKNDTIINQKTDTLHSENIQDSLFNDLYSLKTIPLPPGKYNLKVDYLDLNNDKIITPNSNQISIEIKKLEVNKISLSNIQLADYINSTKVKNQFSKYGFDVYPHLGNYLSNECSLLPIYFEIYSPEKTKEKIKIEYKIINKENNKEFYTYIDTTLETKGLVTPIVHVININSLPTGNYSLIIKNEGNTKSSNTNFDFYRLNENISQYEKTNKILDPNFHKSLKSDSLTFFAKSLIPIMYNEDHKILTKLLKESDTLKIRNFIESFWISTASNNTYQEWIKYKYQVLLIEKLYKTHNVHGFETERGRVYLKYGPPTAIKTKETSPSEYPYEIWQYDKIKNFSNKRFVFYNPDIVGNNFRLLHSDMLGEIKNYKWPGLLTKRNNSTINVDDPLEGGFDHFGGQSRDVFNQY